jgi:hypothetical protein
MRNVIILATVAVAVLCSNFACGDDDSGATCGNGRCDPGAETCAICPADCGACPASCNTTSCPTGCCSSDACLAGNTMDACGTGAAACTTCTAGQGCLSGACAALGGTGDACTADEECAGGDCAGLARWCSHSPCSSNANCLGTGAGGRNNSSGNFNYCTSTTSGYQCFPGCATDADCLGYAYGDCRALNTITGDSELVCASPG